MKNNKNHTLNSGELLSPAEIDEMIAKADVISRVNATIKKHNLTPIPSQTLWELDEPALESLIQKLLQDAGQMPIISDNPQMQKAFEETMIKYAYTLKKLAKY